VALALALAGITACASDDPLVDGDRATSTTSTTVAAEPSTPELPEDRSTELVDACERGELRVRTAGQLPPQLTSVSGLAASPRHAGIVWAVEASLEPAEVVALDLTGQVVATVRLAGGPLMNLDWEALAVGPGPDGAPWIHVADIGDNFGLRPTVRILRFPEPDLADAEVTPESLVARYESGRPNAEAMLVDLDGGIWVIDKDPDGPAAVRELDGEVLRERSRLDLPGEQVTAIDRSRDGTVVAVRTNEQLRLHAVPPGGDLIEALATEGCTTPPLDEHQGESVALLADGSGLVTVSENEAGAPVDLHLTGP
jgi:hypothetical protein